jgi:hypothetical protein
MLPPELSDDDVIARAHQLAAKRKGRIDGCEVWDGGARLVMRHLAAEMCVDHGDGRQVVAALSWRRMTSLKLSPGSRVAGIAPHIWRLVTISTYAEALAAIASNSPSSNRSRTMSARSRRSIQGEMALRSLDCNSARPP